MNIKSTLLVCLMVITSISNETIVAAQVDIGLQVNVTGNVSVPVESTESSILSALNETQLNMDNIKLSTRANYNISNGYMSVLAIGQHNF